MELNERIDEVFLKTIKMFDLTIKYLNSSLSYFKDDLKDENKEEINDDLIDQSLIEIEKECLNIILRERPFAKDLRKVTGLFKLVDDVERLGDHSEDISWCIENLKRTNNLKLKPKSLINMIEVALKMVNDSYLSLIKVDKELSYQTLKTDDLVDTLYLEVLEELSLIKEKHQDNDFIIYMTLVSKYIERIADHASNIAEWAIYINDGHYKDEVII